MNKNIIKAAAVVMLAGVLCSQTNSDIFAKNKLVKKGSGYYLKNGKKSVSGLKKVGGAYYYFDKKGAMKSGFKTIKGSLYCFSKKGAKSPAITNAKKSYKGKTYYFSGKGKGFISSGNVAGDKAVATIYDKCNFKKSGNSKAKLQKLYETAMGYCSYLGVAKPDLNGTWVYASATDMIKKKKGNCYSYASLVGLLAHSVGYKTKIVVGKCDRNNGKATEHSWVLVDDKYVLDGVFEDIKYKSGGTLTYFFKTYDELGNKPGYKYTTNSSVDL